MLALDYRTSSMSMESSTYTLTQKPYHANKIFPCFDQPDLKETFKLTVLAPNDWIIASNECTEHQES